MIILIFFCLSFIGLFQACGIRVWTFWTRSLGLWIRRVVKTRRRNQNQRWRCRQKQDQHHSSKAAHPSSGYMYMYTYRRVVGSRLLQQRRGVLLVGPGVVAVSRTRNAIPHWLIEARHVGTRQHPPFPPPSNSELPSLRCSHHHRDSRRTSWRAEGMICPVYWRILTGSGGTDTMPRDSVVAIPGVFELESFFLPRLKLLLFDHVPLATRGRKLSPVIGFEEVGRSSRGNLTGPLRSHVINV